MPVARVHILEYNANGRVRILEYNAYGYTARVQGSDTRARTQKNPVGFFWVNPPLKTRLKNPAQKQANFDVIFHSNKGIFY